MVPAVGIEPTRPQGTRDFESRASTSSTTPAQSCKGLKEQKNLKNYILASGPCQGNKGNQGALPIRFSPNKKD